MSWSITERFGKPEKIRERVATEFDTAAKMYAGKTEETDVLGAKAAVLAFLDEANCSETEGVKVVASGSRGQGWVNVTVQCNKISLMI